MSVPTSNYQNPYTGDGVTTTFSFNWRVIGANLQDGTMVQVYLGAPAVLQNPSTYTVAIDPSWIGGTVTFNVAPANLTKILLQRNSDLYQNNSLGNNQALPPDTLINMFDKLTIIMQQLNTALSLSLGFPITTTGFNAALPAPVAGAIYAVNAAANAMVGVNPNTVGYALVDNGVGNPPSYQPVTSAAGGNVVGAASSTVGTVPTFANTTGKALASSSYIPPATMGTSGQFQQSQGAGVAPIWALPNAFALAAVQTANFNAVAGNGYPVDTSTQAVTCTLPTAVGIGGQEICIWLANNGHNLTLNTTGGQLISGQASGVIVSGVRYNFFRVMSDNANWIQE